MVSGDFCKHEWPGSGCKECQKESDDYVIDAAFGSANRFEQAFRQLMTDQDLPAVALVRQMLTLYQIHHSRLKAGETQTWSGDRQRLIDFAGPLVEPEPYSVLQDWTMKISHRQQGVMILALRGPDGLTKESGCKNVIRSLRACVMNSAELRGLLGKGQSPNNKSDRFLSMQFISDPHLWKQELERFVADIDTYNVHFLQHFLHAAMVLAFNHPDEYIADRWMECANRIAKKLHIRLESAEEFMHRLRDGERTEAEEKA